MYGWYSKTAKDAPIGAVSFVALALVSGSALFYPALESRIPVIAGSAIALIILGYLLFPAAVACSVYSVVFERSRTRALAGLAVTGVTFLAVPQSRILLDGLLILPLWFLAVIGSVKFARWQVGKRRANATDQPVRLR